MMGHIEGLMLRTYDPQSHQWSLYWANAKTGIMDPPQVGEFKNGRGEFYAQDRINGKVILIRFVWTDVTTNTPHFEQSFSDDGADTSAGEVSFQSKKVQARPVSREPLFDL
jgi:hypothetical protein